MKNDDGTCQACDVSTKVFEKNHCFTKVEHCAHYLYHREGELCRQCESGYTLYLGKCVQTISGCEEYYANGQCKSCIAGYELDDGSCDLVISGLYIWSNKQQYKGDFVNGIKHGKGKYKWPDGYEYDGEYNNGVREGFGEYKWSDGRVFKGRFKDNKPDA